MNYYNIINSIKNVSLKHKLVKEFNEGDIYERLNSGEHKYPYIHITTSNITTDGYDLQTLNGTIFYVDRLKDETDNEVAVQSNGVTILKQIFAKLEDDSIMLENSQKTFTPFTEKFADLCAGVFVTFSIIYKNDVVCVDSEFETKTITLTKNALYDVVGYDKALVAVPIEEKSVLYTENGEYTITPSAGYEGFSKVNVSVNIPIEEKTVNITSGDSVTIIPSEGYEGMSNVNVNVGKIKVNTCRLLFMNIVNSDDKIPNLYILDTSSVNDFIYMFYVAASSSSTLSAIDLSMLNMRVATNISGLFYNQNSLMKITLPIMHNFRNNSSYYFLLNVSGWTGTESADKQLFLTHDWTGTTAYTHMMAYLNLLNFRGTVTILD